MLTVTSRMGLLRTFTMPSSKPSFVAALSIRASAEIQADSFPARGTVSAWIFALHEYGTRGIPDFARVRRRARWRIG